MELEAKYRIMRYRHPALEIRRRISVQCRKSYCCWCNTPATNCRSLLPLLLLLQTCKAMAMRKYIRDLFYGPLDRCHREKQWWLSIWEATRWRQCVHLAKQSIYNQTAGTAECFSDRFRPRRSISDAVIDLECRNSCVRCICSLSGVQRHPDDPHVHYRSSMHASVNASDGCDPRDTDRCQVQYCCRSGRGGTHICPCRVPKDLTRARAHVYGGAAYSARRVRQGQALAGHGGPSAPRVHATVRPPARRLSRRPADRCTGRTVKTGGDLIPLWLRQS